MLFPLVFIVILICRYSYRWILTYPIGELFYPGSYKMTGSRNPGWCTGMKHAVNFLNSINQSIGQNGIDQSFLILTENNIEKKCTSMTKPVPIFGWVPNRTYQYSPSPLVWCTAAPETSRGLLEHWIKRETTLSFLYLLPVFRTYSTAFWIQIYRNTRIQDPDSGTT